LFPGCRGAREDEGDGFLDEARIAVNHLFELQPVHIGHVHGGDDDEDPVLCIFQIVQGVGGIWDEFYIDVPNQSGKAFFEEDLFVGIVIYKDDLADWLFSHFCGFKFPPGSWNIGRIGMLWAPCSGGCKHCARPGGAGFCRNKIGT